jgi:predicted esterase
MAMQVVEYTIPANIHGRYLVSAGTASNAPLLVGFHGYGETAEEHLERLRAIPGAEDWTVVSVQGLHQFYRRKMNEVVASWMTRQNRELHIADNVNYAVSVIRRLSAERPAAVVLAGFSQGVAMAFRTAVVPGMPVAGVIACGGDVPPELTPDALRRIPNALLGRGALDEWYTADKVAEDERRLQAAGVAVRSVILNTGHEWTAEFSEACGQVLRRPSSPEGGAR